MSKMTIVLPNETHEAERLPSRKEAFDTMIETGNKALELPSGTAEKTAALKKAVKAARIYSDILCSEA